MRDYSGLDRALDALQSDLYPDIEMGSHTVIVRSSIKKLTEMGILKQDLHVLDVGTGCGTSENMLTELGCSVQAIDLKPQKPHVIEADQSFLPFYWTCMFDLVWARHVLEHSIMPLYTLTEYRRVLKTGGYAYVEVPAPDTECHHESNQNHYSVFGLNAWGSLMMRSFEVVDTWEYRFGIPQSSGKPMNDKYWAFLLRKEKAT